MTIILTITEAQIFKALGDFLTQILPAGVTVVRGQVNRTPSPLGEYVTMTHTLRPRMATNIDDFNECLFEGSISGTTLTVSSVLEGALAADRQLFGINVQENTTIVSGSGTTWTVDQSQTAALSQMSAGTNSLLQKTGVTIQLDIHGAESTNNAQRVTTMFRDEYASEFFATTGLDIAPLYTSDAQQMPFITGEQSYEDRWVVDVLFEINAYVTNIPQSSAGELEATVVEVETA